jgi:aspartyl-tRNA(Asn)/glutamyl-tRNA(Gln) amidotransferase subunit C
MAEPISKDEVRRMAALAQLELDDAEVERLAVELASILAYVRTLERVDVDGVEPTAHVMVERLPLCDDEPAPSLPRDMALGGAPQVSDGGFAVPAYVED